MNTELFLFKIGIVFDVQRWECENKTQQMKWNEKKNKKNEQTNFLNVFF